MVNWKQTRTIACRKCGKVFQTGSHVRRFCPDSDCFKQWRDERYQRNKKRWEYEHPKTKMTWSVARVSPQALARKRDYERQPHRVERHKQLYYARKAAQMLGGSTRDMLIAWGIDPGRASDRRYRKPKEETTCIQKLPSHWHEKG